MLKYVSDQASRLGGLVPGAKRSGLIFGTGAKRSVTGLVLGAKRTRLFGAWRKAHKTFFGIAPA